MLSANDLDAIDPSAQPGVRIRTADNGRLVVSKHATGHASAQRLSREAQMLLAARHPGVVELITADINADRGELTLAWAGSRTLADVTSLTLEEIAGVTVALASTLAHLHGIGITHGRIRAEHVVVNPEGAPVLCGFSEAGRADAADDILSIGHLMMAMFETCHTPHTRGRPGFRRGRIANGLGRLEHIAASASDADPNRRPSAAALAHDVRKAITSAELINTPGSDEHDGTEAPSTGVCDRGTAPVEPLDVIEELESIVAGGRLRRTRRHRSKAVFATLCLVFVGTSLKIAATPSASRPSTEAGGDTPTRPPDPPSVTTPGAPVVEHAGTRFRLGNPGDIALVADWNCNGNPVPAVIRPPTREVFVFDAWASVDAPTAASPTLTLPEGVDISTATADPTRCGTLLVSGAEGPGMAVTITNSKPLPAGGSTP